MADLLRQGAQWLEQMRTAHCSSPVTYQRGDTQLTVDATFGRTEYEIADESGLTIGSHVWDFLVTASVLEPTFGEPQRGDLIIADGRRFEAMDLAGEGAWRWSDPYRTTCRIHTRDIGPAE